MATNLTQSRMIGDAGVLSGFRNKIINGDFDIWQRGTSQSTSGYGSDDRWANLNLGHSRTNSRVTFALGFAGVPGSTHFSRTNITTHVVGAGNYARKEQRIERVLTLSGKKATITFYAKASSARNMAIELVQRFGTGGTPSADVTGIGINTVALTTSFQKFTITVDIPSVSGKTIGANNDDALILVFWFDAGTDYDARTNSLGQQGIGYYDLARVSLVEGDATAEDDPFSPRHIQQELLLCQRYYETVDERVLGGSANAVSAGHNMFQGQSFLIPKRVTPTVVLAINLSANCEVNLGLIYPTGFYLNKDAIAAGYLYFLGSYTADAEL